MSFDSNHLDHSNTTHIEKTDIYHQDIQYSEPHHDAKGKKKQRLPEVNPNEPCFIQQLSVEVMLHIFARLDPISLATVAKVCHFWRQMVMDDSCWRDAFVSYFGRLPFKRLSTESWKTEYVLRTHLIRKWTKSRGTVMSFQPKIGSIESMHVDFENASMLVSSAEQGIAVKCNVATGKVHQRHPFYSTHDNIRLPITATLIEKDRILWGFDAGYITLSTSKKGLIVFSDFHQGPVSLLCLPKQTHDVVISGGLDGTVKLWDVATTSCAWTFSSSKTPTCIKTSVDHRLIVGYDDGSVAVWLLNLNQLVRLHRNNRIEGFEENKRAWIDSLEKNKRWIHAPAKTHAAVHSMSYDPETHALMVAYTGKSQVCKYNLDTGACLAVFDHRRPVTCMKWDKTVPSTLISLESALIRSTSKQRKAGTRIHLSSASTTASVPSPDQGAKTTHLLVTGDDLGTLYLWDSNQDHPKTPVRTLSEGHITAISCIYLDAFKLVTGSDDGWIRVWDPLTGINLCTLGNKIPKHAPVDRSDVHVMRVKNLWCSHDYRGVATIGHQVKVWDFSPDKQFLTRPLKPKSNRPITRDRFRYEIKDEVKESMDKIASEKQDREREEKELNKLSLGGLTDEEMLDYAMMLSQQEHTPSSDFVDVDDEELMKAVIASLNVNQHTSSSDQSEWNEEEWPTVSEATSIQDEDDMDEDMRYILELSKTDK
ncbi:quinon protein alcohol dehydrogenase-like superfamily [Gilbertella persicaria]|uniref:quinon protein alcohol dehydrogenase-like superfamily n=1 Tax=Gilbertella persicaria TaxID=101096 RepID=UPI00221EE572|nr:quinon protein alcohol dehydrogenase-like superfamily [Gilbertella persicaria]KAI8077295.1 quinon protein alcohol dehydrogenase-like superfamily [Gilbertella persicaria]